MKGQKDQVLIRRRVASDQGIDFLSHMRFCVKHFSRILPNLKQINEYINIFNPQPRHTKSREKMVQVAPLLTLGIER